MKFMNNKKKVSNKMEQEMETFYKWFKQSKLYHLTIFLVIFLGILFIPTGRFIADMFDGGPFIAGPYITLLLMFIVFTLYTNIYLYLFSIALFIFSSLVSFVGIAMGSIKGSEVLIFFLPIAIFLIINVYIATFTYKYKKRMYK